MVKFSGGAKRSDVKPRYHLIDRDFLAGVATVLGEGERKYGPNNWTKGDQTFAVDAVNHVIEHIYKFLEGDRTENHLMHASCGLMFVNRFFQEHPEWF